VQPENGFKLVYRFTAFKAEVITFNRFKASQVKLLITNNAFCIVHYLNKKKEQQHISKQDYFVILV
jgi:hypothetical protein